MRVPPKGHVLRQPDLARTLARLQKHGASEFYRGETAKLIAADVQSAVRLEAESVLSRIQGDGDGR